MLSFFTPTAIVAFVLGLSIWLVLFVSLLKTYSPLRHRRAPFKIFKIDNPKILGEHLELLQSINPPFVLEIAVHHLGKKVNYYLLAPRSSRIKNPAFEEVKDYDLYHHGGYHLGVSLRAPEARSWRAIDLKKLDFSKVNEIGEGVVIQLLIQKRRRKKSTANLRVLISAPSAYQTKEILAVLESAFPGFKIVEATNREFIHEVNAREFNDKESILLSYNAKPLRR
ncbi:MAG TPA: hypothetical protein VJA63_01920 [Candidatus Paceibacterota bacterium]